jgi:hypothetical protein
VVVGRKDGQSTNDDVRAMGRAAACVWEREADGGRLPALGTRADDGGRRLMASGRVVPAFLEGQLCLGKRRRFFLPKGFVASDLIVRSGCFSANVGDRLDH